MKKQTKNLPVTNVIIRYDETSLFSFDKELNKISSHTILEGFNL